MRFKDLRQAVASDGGKYLKLQDGPNKVRLVSEPKQIWKVFNGKDTETITDASAAKAKDAKMRFAMYVIDRAAGEVKIAEFGPSIMGQVADLAESDEYGFEGLPPYDMTIVKEGSGMDTEYKVIAARQNTELTTEEKAKVAAMGSLDAQYGGESIPF